MYQLPNHRLSIVGLILVIGLLLNVVLTIQMRFSCILVILFYLLILQIRLIKLVVISLCRLLIFATRTQNSLTTPYSLFFLGVAWSLFCRTRRSDHGELAVVLASWSALFVISTDIASRILIYGTCFATHHQRRLCHLYPTFFRGSSSGLLKDEFITLGLRTIFILLLNSLILIFWERVMVSIEIP